MTTILLVSHSPHLYGAERSLLDLACGLRDRGRYQPSVLLPKLGPLHDALIGHGVPVQVARYYHWIGQRGRMLRAPISLALNLRALRGLHTTAQRLQPALIYSNTLATPVGAQLAHRLGVPHVWHARELVGRGVRERFDFGRERSLRFVARRSCMVVCNSNAVHTRLAESIPSAPFRVVYNGFAFAHPAPDSARHHARTVVAGPPPRLLLAGAVHRNKGHEDALRALPLLRAAGQPALLEIVGAGPDAEERRLRALATELGVAAQVHWAGYVTSTDAHLDTAAVALSCSRSEAFGRTAVEAMAHGVPTVVAETGGLTEVVDDGNTGLRYPPGNAPALADALRRLLSEPDLHDRLAAAGQRSVRTRFTLAAHLDGIEAVLDQAVTPDRR